MTSLSVRPITDDSIDLFGKTASDLQSNIVVGRNAITGTLKYIGDYSSAFGGDLSSGNYIALHAEVSGVEDATITVTVTNPVELDEDGNMVLRIADKSSQTITIVASKEGFDSVTKEFTLTGLICESSDSPEPEPSTDPPITGLTVTPLSEMTQIQSDVVVGTDAITGTLHYVTDYVGAPEGYDNDGNFMALHAETDVSGATIEFHIGYATLTANAQGNVIVRVEDKDTETLQVTASKEGYSNATKTFSLTGLTCEEQSLGG